MSQTSKALGAFGFVLCVENAYLGTRFDPIHVGLPSILIKEVSKSNACDPFLITK